MTTEEKELEKYRCPSRTNPFRYDSKGRKCYVSSRPTPKGKVYQPYFVAGMTHYPMGEKTTDFYEAARELVKRTVR